MTPDEVIEALKRDFNIDISPSTLSRYARQGVTPKPVVRSLGRGEGRESEYTQEQFAEIVASCWLIHHEGARLVEVADVRRLALWPYDLDSMLRGWDKPLAITFDELREKVAWRGPYERQPALDLLFDEAFEPKGPFAYVRRNKPTRRSELLASWLRVRALASGGHSESTSTQPALLRGSDGLYRWGLALSSTTLTVDRGCEQGTA